MNTYQVLFKSVVPAQSVDFSLTERAKCHLCQLERNQGHCYGLLHSKEMPKPPLGSYPPCCSLHGSTPHFEKKESIHIEMFLTLLSLKLIVVGEVLFFCLVYNVLLTFDLEIVL